MAEQKAVMKCTEQFVAHFKGADAESNPVDPNSVIWTSSDESVATLVPSENGLDCNVIGGAPGECKVVANATAQGGKKAVLSVLAVTVTVGEVVSGTIETETPVDQGTAPDQGLPSRPPRPSHGLPNTPGLRPDQGLPNTPGLRPDAGLPTQPGHPEAGLPNVPARPDAGLPPGAQPKK